MGPGPGKYTDRYQVFVIEETANVLLELWWQLFHGVICSQTFTLDIKKDLCPKKRLLEGGYEFNKKVLLMI